MNFTKKNTKFIGIIMALLLVCLFVVDGKNTNASGYFISNYIQTVYNVKNGIGSNEVKCVYQSTSGYIWVGTDGGLYRSNGAGFSSIDLWDTERADVYSINCITQDSKGRMWIGTDNYGLFYIENGKTMHLQDEYYSGVKTILDVCELPDGTIYVSTANGIYTCEQKEDNTGLCLKLYENDKLPIRKYYDLEVVNNTVWALDSGNKIAVISQDDNVKIVDFDKDSYEEITGLATINDRVYATTSGNQIIVISGERVVKSIDVTVEGINKLMLDEDGKIWVVADTGIGYLKQNDEFVAVNGCEIDNYLSDIIKDYEGNYWIASRRFGLLSLSRSKFVDFNMQMDMEPSIVNCVFTKGDKKYIGTDDGLVIYDAKNKQVTNDLTDMLSSVSIRHITEDASQNIWISTYRRYGIIKVSPSGKITIITRIQGLPSYGVNFAFSLHDGRMAVATDAGVAIIEKDDSVKKIFDENNGLVNANVLCLYQDENDKLLCGTDGGGLYELNIYGDQVKNYTVDDGLNSNVVTSIASGAQGLWIGTDNGLCLYNESFRTISNIDFSYNIYDILIDDLNVWIIGSKGVLQTNEEELLSSKGLVRRAYDKNDGLTKDINSICKTTIDMYGRMYICCNNGISVLDTKNIPFIAAAPKIKVTSIDVDGKNYEIDDLDSEFYVKSTVSRITINFAVFSFNNRENVRAEYSLEGFDENPIVVNGNNNMEAVYTNLDGGRYMFKLMAYNGDGKASEKEISFVIEKEKKLTEKASAKYIFVLLVVVGFVFAVYLVIRIRKIIKSNNKEIEKLSKEHEQAVKSSSAKNDYLANMSNEIKMPINAIMAKTDELISSFGGDEALKESLMSIYDTSSFILDKVDDMILLAKLDAGKIEIVSEKYSVTTMMYELSEIAMQLIGDKSVKFFVEIGDNISDNVVGDSSKIKAILLRILDNAVKYTKEGSITLSVDCYEYTDENNANSMNFVYTVSDTGIGIQEDRLETIFEISQNSDSKNNIHSGNGIGLAIAKGYADAIGAELEVESAYGAGSAFTLSVIQNIADRGPVANAYKVEETVSKEVASKLWLPEVSALLVDDEEVGRDVAVNVLSQFEMKVDVASSGLSAIDMVLNNSYDVVFMDLSMPIMSGIDAMKEIRELAGDAYEYMPIVSMDSNAIEDNKQALLEAGFTDTLIKPLDIRRVAAILKDCLPESKIKEKTNDITIYIEGSRYSDGLNEMKSCVDVEAAIEKIGGSIDVFNKLIVAYYNQNSNAVEDLFEKFEHDLRGFKAKIHTIKTTSINIGAYKYARDASNLEAAINIGNKEYVRDNIEEFARNMQILINTLAVYIDFMESVSGMTDEEYAKKHSKDSETGSEIVLNVSLLEEMAEHAKESDFEFLDTCVEGLHNVELDPDDEGFVSALAEVVSNKDVDAICDIISTYISLKL